MVFFIPAWYKKDSWDENEQCWYRRRNKSEYDDTVKQIQLFHRKGEWPYNVIVLSYVPNFRHYLHRQGMFRANYWSCFDAMCCITKRKISLFSYLDLKWPEGVEFEYSPFLIVAYKDDKKYAHLEFGEDGNLIRVDIFADNQIIRSNCYDDRGFVSSSIVYDKGVEQYRDYLNESGIRKLRVYSNDGHVEIALEQPYFLIRYHGEDYQLEYKKSEYSSIDEVIKEVFLEYIALTEENDVFCVAIHDRHSKMVMECLKTRKKILSFFEGRLPYTQKNVKEMIDEADYVVTDSENTTNIVKNYCNTAKNVLDISPYDSRTDFGISQQLTSQNILVPIDKINDEIFKRIVLILTRYIEANENVKICLFTRKADFNINHTVLKKVSDILESAGFDGRIALNEDAQNQNSMIDSEEIISPRFYVEQCVDELAVSKCIKEQRILVDMHDIPELYVQIAALSTCIPQIVRGKTQYIEDGENGRIVDEPEEVIKWLHFYLDGLANWNEAKICSYEMSKQFSTEVLLEKWRKVIEALG